MSSTEIAYGALRCPAVCHGQSDERKEGGTIYLRVWFYAMCGTDGAYDTMRCATMRSFWEGKEGDKVSRYAMCGTKIAYGAMRCPQGGLKKSPTYVVYSPSFLQPNPTGVMLPWYAMSGTDIAYRATFPALTTRIVLLNRHAMSGTDIAYGATSRLAASRSRRYLLRYLPTRLLCDV
eukprot:1827789-Rhodomonas_salina.1